MSQDVNGFIAWVGRGKLSSEKKLCGLSCIQFPFLASVSAPLTSLPDPSFLTILTIASSSSLFYSEGQQIVKRLTAACQKSIHLSFLLHRANIEVPVSNIFAKS